MKWILMALLAAGVLIGLSVYFTGNSDPHQVSKHPEAVALCEEGTEDLHAFRLRAAVSKLGQCLELDPSLAEASISRALAYARLGESDNFKIEVVRADSLTGAIADDKRRMLAQLRLSGIGNSEYHSMRDSILTRLKVEDPNNLFVLVAQATEAYNSGTQEEAERAWQVIIDKNPNYANSYNMLGYMELNQGNYEKAIEYMQKYAFLAPDLANPHDSLGEVLMVLGRYEEAEREFLTSVKMQPDFYHSLINLGKSHLERGQLKKGLDILEKVRGQVAGSELEKRVDKEIVSTYLVAGLDSELGRMAGIYIERYPDDGMSAFYRGVRLAYEGRVDDGRAVMDSALTKWCESDEYHMYDKAKTSIDAAGYQFDGLMADITGDHKQAVVSWAKAVALLEAGNPFHETWYPKYRLASALREDALPEQALAEIAPILEVNPRLHNVLILKVECLLDLNEGDAASQALEQLKWALRSSDQDYPPRARADELTAKVADVVGAP